MSEILLMGGLGNQLFQLAAGLYYSRKGTVLLDDLGKPRRNEQNFTELESFTLPKGVYVHRKASISFLSQKMLNYGIRIGARSSSRNLQIQLVEKTTGLLCLLNPEKFISLELNCGTGFDPKFSPSDRAVSVGYFQSGEFLRESRVLNQLMSLRLANPSAMFLDLEKKAEDASPIVVHIRLGDYTSESSFGIPSESYYENGIKRIDQGESQVPIWLFSNEPSKAIDLIPRAHLPRVFVVPTQGLSSAESLELMRRGSAYVIANSTFSWWGAMLSFHRKSQVVAPAPWFLSVSTPNLIYPDSWIRMPANFENSNREAE